MVRTLDREKVEQAVREGRVLTLTTHAYFSDERDYTDMAEAYAGIEDTSEGAGLGIVMMIIMLRSLGLSESIIRFFTNDSEAFALLTVPVLDTPQATGVSG